MRRLRTGGQAEAEGQDVKLPKSAEIVRTSGSGFALMIDGVEFPWPIEREPAEVINLTPGQSDPWCVLRMGIIIGGPITGAEAFNEALDDELDASRVRRADMRDLARELV